MVAVIRGIISALLFVLNTILWCGLIYLLMLVKFLVPVRSFKDWCTTQMVGAAENWISCNGAFYKMLHNIRWRTEGLEGLSPNRSYLVCANHRSGVDIAAMQEVLNRRIPFMRFFIKQELQYVPLLGLAWKALDFPMMKRHSAAYLAKHPEKKGEDLATTKKICDKLRGKRISVMNFVEGTRLTPEKHAKQHSPFKNLLKPKAGGLAFVLNAMGDQFYSFLDVTVYYPKGHVTLWDLMCGRVNEVMVHVRELKIPPEFCGGDYFGDSVYRAKLYDWIYEIWARKDRLLDEMIASG